MALKTNLSALWPLNETSDGTSADVNRIDSVGSLVLIDSNRVASTAGLYSQNAALFVAASSEYLDITDNATLNQPGSLAIWVRLTATVTSNQTLIAKWNTIGNQREYWLLWDSATDRFRFSVSNDGAATVSVTANSFGAPARNGTQWCWVYCDHNPGVDIGISVNNGTRDSTSHTTGILNGTSSFELGRRVGTTYIDGALQQCSVWSAPKSAGERAAIYNGGAGLPYTSWDAGMSGSLRYNHDLLLKG